MPPSYVWLWVAVNILTLATALVGIGRWFRKWLLQLVSEPLANLDRTATAAKNEAKRANARLDRHIAQAQHGNGRKERHRG